MERRVNLWSAWMALAFLVGCAGELAEPCAEAAEDGSGECAEQERDLGVSSAALGAHPPRTFAVSGTVEPAGGGTVAARARWRARCEGSSCEARWGASVTLAATPANNYQFLGWSGCSESTNPTLTLPFIHADVACIARFRPTFVVISTSVWGMYRGQVTMSGGGCEGAGACVVPYGTVLTLQAPERESFRFAGWGGCATSTDPTLVLVAEVSATCVAIMEAITAELSWSVVPEGGGTVMHGGGPDIVCTASSCEVLLGWTMVLEAVAEPGYRFVAWSDCVDATEPRIEITPEDQTPRHCEARFEPAP